MEILSPQDRAVLWHHAISSGPSERGSMRRVLAKEILQSVVGHLDLYAGCEEKMVESVELLDEAGYLGRDDLRQAFERADADLESAASFIVLLADHLRAASDVERLGAERRLGCLRLAGEWREHLLEGPRERGYLSVPQVAARYEVTRQAVYRWIEQGRIQAERTPGGSYRIPASQLERSERVDRKRLAALRRRLVERHGDAPPISDEELAEEIARRRGE